eukprot:g41514.t1
MDLPLNRIPLPRHSPRNKQVLPPLLSSPPGPESPDIVIAVLIGQNNTKPNHLDNPIGQIRPKNASSSKAIGQKYVRLLHGAGGGGK